MANASAAGKLRWQFRFDRRALDANGDLLAAYAPYYTCAARLQCLHGAESVMAERLEGRQPVIITIRACTISRGLTTADRAVDIRSGQIYNIQGIEPDESRIWIDVLATSVAGGGPG